MNDFQNSERDSRQPKRNGQRRSPRPPHQQFDVCEAIFPAKQFCIQRTGETSRERNIRAPLIRCSQIQPRFAGADEYLHSDAFSRSAAFARLSVCGGKRLRVAPVADVVRNSSFPLHEQTLKYVRIIAYAYRYGFLCDLYANSDRSLKI